MKGLNKTAKVVGKVIGLFFGDNFTTPTLEVMEKYPDRYASLA